MRAKVLVTSMKLNSTLDSRMLTTMTTNRKLVPQRGWCRGWMRTFSTVRGRPCS